MYCPGTMVIGACRAGKTGKPQGIRDKRRCHPVDLCFNPVKDTSIGSIDDGLTTKSLCSYII